MNNVTQFLIILDKTQQHISEKYSAALTNKEKRSQLKTYIEKYLRDNGLDIEGLTVSQLTDKLYSEMAEYSFLTKYLGRNDVEEINSATRS